MLTGILIGSLGSLALAAAIRALYNYKDRRSRRLDLARLREMVG